jgi:hypothetical protein
MLQTCAALQRALRCNVRCLATCAALQRARALGTIGSNSERRGVAEGGRGWAASYAIGCAWTSSIDPVGGGVGGLSSNTERQVATPSTDSHSVLCNTPRAQTSAKRRIPYATRTSLRYRVFCRYGARPAWCVGPRLLVVCRAGFTVHAACCPLHVPCNNASVLHCALPVAWAWSCASGVAHGRHGRWVAS